MKSMWEDSLFSTRQNEVLRRATACWLRQEGLEHFLGMQTLAWQGDFVGARDAKLFGRIPDPSQKASPPASGRNTKHAPHLFSVPPTCSPHRKVDAGPAHPRTPTHPLGLTGTSLISRHLKPRKEKIPRPFVMPDTKNIPQVLLHGGSRLATEITQSQT